MTTAHRFHIQRPAMGDSGASLSVSSAADPLAHELVSEDLRGAPMSQMTGVGAGGPLRTFFSTTSSARNMGRVSLWCLCPRAVFVCSSVTLAHRMVNVL